MADQYGAATDQPQDDSAVQEDPAKLTSYWLGQVTTAERKYKKFWARGDQIIRRYKNKSSYNAGGIKIGVRKMNVLWANVQTAKPVLYSQTPKANVQRRNKDKDPIGRVAAQVLERVLDNSLDMQPFDHTVSMNVQDLLLPGQSVSITEYVPELEQDQIKWQKALTRYIHWKDWITNIARNWDEVWFWAYRVYLTRKEVKTLLLRTGSDAQRADTISQEIVLDHAEDQRNKTEDSSAAQKAVVWCIWDKTTERVLQIATGWPREPLAVMPPPVRFDGFFPIPRPLQATVASDSTLPVPDFNQYQDQADEIDLLTQRINALVKSLRMRGVYAADVDAIRQMMENSSDQDMIPIDSWQMLMDKGGLEKALAWFPLEQVAATLLHCYEARDQAKQVMYEITGMSDLMRAATDAEETATAQQLKSQYGQLRVRERQREVQRFIRDIIRLQGEIVSEHFTQPVLQAMSGVKILTDQQKQTIQMYQQYMQQYQQQAQMMVQQGMQPPPPPSIPQPTEEMMEAMKEPSWEQVMGLLRNDKLRGFVVKIETDSTVEADQMQEQQKATEFIAAITQFMTAALPILQESSLTPAGPKIATLVGSMLQWGARQFRAGDALETEIEEAAEALEQSAQQIAQQPPPPDPKVQAETVKAQSTIQNEQMKGQTAQMKAGVEVQKAQADIVQTQEEHAGTMREKAMDMELAREQHQQAMREAKAKPKPNGGNE